MATYTSTTSNPTIPVSWAETLTADVTTIKMSHLTELRNALFALDGHIHTFDGHNSGGELPNRNVSWGEAITQDVTAIKASHVNELIGYLKQMNGHYHDVPNFDYAHTVAKSSSAYTQTQSFTVDPVVADSGSIRAVSLNELRTMLQSFNTHTHTICCECECTCICTCQCTGYCGCTCNCTCTCKIS